MKALAIVLAVVFALAAIDYWAGMPPLAAGHPHLKHGILCAILAVLSLVWLRFLARSPARV